MNETYDAFHASGEPRRTCACNQVHMELLDRYPRFRTNQSQIQQFTQHFLQSGAFSRVSVRRIPVVVHVVHHTIQENISDAQVRSQLDVLNEDFRARNSDIDQTPNAFKDLVADPRIEFHLADEDPQGNPTNGITRTRTSVTRFGTEGDPVKFAAAGGADSWGTDRYLNIWVCTLRADLLGYAQFPGGPPQTDGVVVRNTAFGKEGTASTPFDRGRTCVHEIGHFLNLNHIWGNNPFPTCHDSDGVADTPNQFGPNTSTPVFPHVSCNNSPHGDLFMNFMDYVDDAAMFMFTHGQVARMRAALAGPRAGLGIEP